MKKILFILTITGFIFTSCGSETKKEESDTHTHEDGTVHGNDAHNHESTVMPEQESFEVEADSTVNDTVEDVNDHGHDHENDHGHQH